MLVWLHGTIQVDQTCVCIVSRLHTSIEAHQASVHHVCLRLHHGILAHHIAPIKANKTVVERLIVATIHHLAAVTKHVATESN